jgi:hypothetical protein
MKATWRGVRAEALETFFAGRTWQANEPQSFISKEDSEKLFAKGVYKDGCMIEESHIEIMPDGRAVRVPKSRWLTLEEQLRTHPEFDVEGDPPKPQKRIPRPERYPNAALDTGSGNPWLGNE